MYCSIWENSLCTRKHTLSQIQHQRKEAKNLCVDNSPLEVSQYKSFNYSFRSNTKPSPYSEKGGGSLASTKQADFECDTQLNDQYEATAIEYQTNYDIADIVPEYTGFTQDVKTQQQKQTAGEKANGGGSVSLI